MRRAALRCRARSFAGRLLENRSIDDAAGPLDSADRFLSLLRVGATVIH